jgi:putative oxidoreductase
LPAQEIAVAASGSWIQELLYALLRVVSGLCLGVHGAQKLFGLFGAARPAMGSQLWFGGILEAVCGLAMALGLSRWAAFLASGTMAVAYVQFHWKLAWDVRMVPVVNKGELALVYCLLFAYFAAKGNGRLSVSGS